MERIPTSIALTSTETAGLLDVHPSTVKRWCNDGDLASEVTPGGHRRISIHAVMQLARDRGIETILTPFHPYEPHVWTALQAIEERGSYAELVGLAMQWVQRGQFERLELLYLALGRSELVTFEAFCDFAVRDLLATIGREWEQGKLRVGDEHMVTQAVTGVLMALRREWLDLRASPRPLGGRPAVERPVAVVGSLQGNHHSTGALCIRILLERAGWNVYYPGPDVPVEDFGIIQKSREARLVCISLPPTGSLGDVKRTLDGLRRHYDRSRPYAVAFGGLPVPPAGGGLDAAPFESVDFFSGCAPLAEALEDGLGSVETSLLVGAA